MIRWCGILVWKPTSHFANFIKAQAICHTDRDSQIKAQSVHRVLSYSSLPQDQKEDFCSLLVASKNLSLLFCVNQ